MGLFTNKKKGKAPHTWYPDVLHWREGDTVYCWNLNYVFGSIAPYSSLTKYAPQGGYAKAYLTFKGVTENGHIFLEDEFGNLLELEFYRLIKKAHNESFINRQLTHKLQNTENYMDLMANFQQAFDELQASDNHNYPKKLTNADKKEL